MKTIIWNKASKTDKQAALARPLPPSDKEITARVSEIIENVKARGQEALRDYSLKFDKADIKRFNVSQKEIDAAAKSIKPSLIRAIKRAKGNIERFHKAEMPQSVAIETMPGVKCALVWRAIETVGLYIPAGTAPLFSALLMEALPAKIAGCKNIVLCSPPQKNGKINPVILATAKLCGIKNVFAVGGAQAIAAMAYGTAEIPKVDKIFGPGNIYVTTAKQLVSKDPRGAAIDIPAGQSEVLVIADKKARADWVAADLLAQAEHDTTAQAILVTTDMDFAKKVEKELARQVALLPRREIAEKSLSESRIIVAPDIKTAIQISNLYGPEHLILHDPKAAKLLPKIENAGSVFLGPLTPESAGDYASGTNHVLPTYGYTRSFGGLSVYNYLKNMTVQSLSSDGLKNLGPTIVAMAEAESLKGHANAVKVRMEKKK